MLPTSDESGEGENSEVTLKICVERLADGSFRVYQESGEASEPASEMPGEETGEPGKEKPRTAPDIEGAMNLIMDLLEKNPDDNSPGAQFSAGFKSEQSDSAY